MDHQVEQDNDSWERKEANEMNPMTTPSLLPAESIQATEYKGTTP